MHCNILDRKVPGIGAKGLISLGRASVLLICLVLVTSAGCKYGDRDTKKDEGPSGKSSSTAEKEDAPKSGRIGGAKVHRSGQEILAGLPKDNYPKVGEEFGIERARCEKWCRAHLVGKTIEWSTTIKDIKIDGDEPFIVTLTVEVSSEFQCVAGASVPTCWCFWEPVTLGGQSCQVGLSREFVGGFFPYRCTEAEAKMLRNLKGKRVTMRSEVTDVSVGSRNISVPTQVPIVLTLSPASIDGFLPEAHKAKLEKDKGE